MRFAIISAYATTGERWNPAREEAADAQLLAAICAYGVWHTRVTGYSPTTGHTEPGWAVELPFETACLLGKTFAQDAIYWVDEDTLSVSSCVGNLASALAGGFRARIDVPVPAECLGTSAPNTAV
ncbi:MAG: DUF3293 domain-containing protein [Gemmatimonadota bacterium]